MKITTTKEKMLNAVLLAERIVGKKETLPVLSCILFEATEQLTLRATNLEAGIEIQVPADIEETGTVAVNAHVLSQTIRTISADKVVLRTDAAGNLTIESRGTKTLLKAIPHHEFPSLSKESATPGISLPRELFLRGIQSVVYAASPSMIRPELGSVFVSLQAHRMVCAATDSFRLAEKNIAGITAEPRDILIPLRHAGEMTHVLERLDTDTVELYVDESQMAVRGSGVRYIARVVDAVFPQYGEIIPKSFTTEATLLKGDFSEMLRKARVFSGNDQHVGFHVDPKKKELLATASSADVGEMSDTIDAALSGETIDINFHIGYLGDCLSSIESDSITLGFSGAGRPLVIRGVSDQAFTYLVMPLNR